jgi:hypothetical protein
MRNILLILACLFSASITCAAEQLIQDGPFALVDLSALPELDAQIIREANEDFICVLQGRKPKNIKFDESYALMDGGTVCYKGKGYSLTIVQSLSSFGKLNGYIYGPVIVFDKKFAPGNTNTVSSLRFYTNKQLKELKNQQQPVPGGI